MHGASICFSENYFYLRDFSDINSWLIDCFHNDEHQHLMLVNKNTGKEIHLTGNIVLSPNKRFLISVRLTCTDASTIELLKVEEDSLSQVWCKLFYNFGAEEIKWKNDSTLYIQMRSICVEKTKTRYIKLPVGRYLK